MEQASVSPVSSYFHETDPIRWSLIDFLEWRLEASEFLSNDKEHGTFKYSVEKITNIWKDEIRVQKAQEILDNWNDIKCSPEVVKFWNNHKTKILQRDLQYTKAQNELKILQIKSKDIDYVLDRSKELNLHANEIGSKRHEFILRSHEHSPENYEDGSTNKSDEVMEPVRPCTPEDKIRTVTLSDEPSPLPKLMEDENELEEEPELEEPESEEHESEEHESEEHESDESDCEESDAMYDAVAETQNHDVDKKARKSVIKLNSNNRKEIEEAYTKMKKRCMWRLSSGRYVEEELYNLGKSLEYEHSVHSFIMDVDDYEVKSHFTEDELDELKSASRPVAIPLSDETVDYLEQINKKAVSSLREVRDLINQSDERLGKSYDRSKNHDIDYIRYAVYSMVRELESGSLRQENLESWYNCHVWTPIVDQGFSDINGTSVVRGESTSIATSNRKNIGKKQSDRKKLGRRGDWILRSTGNKNNDEFGAGEAGRKYTDEYDTKILTESKLKLPKMLKDMIVKLLRRVNWNVDKRKQIQTVGIVHSGLSMMILYLDNPCGYVCRLIRGEILEVPDDERFFSSVLLVLAAVLNLKSCVCETIKAVQNKEINKSLFRKAGLLKRSHDDAIEITHCTSTPKKSKKQKSSRN